MNNNEFDRKMRNFNSFEDINKNKDEETDLIFILDKSGSMYDIQKDTIDGFNSFIDREKREHPNTLVTLVLFDTQYKILYTRKPISQVEKLTSEDYYASGCTALLDAIGTTINKVDKLTSDKVLFVITSDGLENSSVEYSYESIKSMIKSHNWEFIFIGADIDSYDVADSIGIRRSRSGNYTKSNRGVRSVFGSVANAKRSLHDLGYIEDSWSDGLE